MFLPLRVRNKWAGPQAPPCVKSCDEAECGRCRDHAQEGHLTSLRVQTVFRKWHLRWDQRRAVKRGCSNEGAWARMQVGLRLLQAEARRQARGGRSARPREGSQERRQHGELVTGALSEDSAEWLSVFQAGAGADLCCRKVTLTTAWRWSQPQTKQWPARRKESRFKRCWGDRMTGFENWLGVVDKREREVCQGGPPGFGLSDWAGCDTIHQDEGRGRRELCEGRGGLSFLTDYIWGTCGISEQRGPGAGLGPGRGK